MAVTKSHLSWRDSVLQYTSAPSCSFYCSLALPPAKTVCVPSRVSLFRPEKHHPTPHRPPQGLVLPSPSYNRMTVLVVAPQLEPTSLRTAWYADHAFAFTCAMCSEKVSDSLKITPKYLCAASVSGVVHQNSLLGLAGGASKK